MADLPRRGKLRDQQAWDEMFQNRDTMKIAEMILDSLSGYTTDRYQDLATLIGVVQALRWPSRPVTQPLRTAHGGGRHDG